MKRAFTIIEVSILFVIFLIVAFLVAPLSMDDTIQATNITKWKKVQSEFNNIFEGINIEQEKNNSKDFDISKELEEILSQEITKGIDAYRITYANNNLPTDIYSFSEYKQTHANATLSLNMFDNPNDDRIGVLMYDVNGILKPNKWGKDVFGLNIYKDRFEPFCKSDSVTKQKDDCKKGTGLCCSNYYLIGGNFD